MSTDLTRIDRKARRMRSAIESIPPKERLKRMRDFPKHEGGDAALLLGAYFVDCGIEGFIRVMGRRGAVERTNRAPHFWLARESLVVDIAADHWWDAPQAIIVADPSRWHKLFRLEDDDTSTSDFREWHGQGIDELHWMYARIRSDLFSSSDE